MFRVIAPMLVSGLLSSHGFLSISVCCVSHRGGRAMWEMKRGLCFPAERKSWIWISPGSGASSPLYILNHLSFKGMFMFAHFSPTIVPEETELMRMLLVKYLHIPQCLSFPSGLVSAPYPTFLMPIFRLLFATKVASHWFRIDVMGNATVSPIKMLHWGEGIHGSTPTHWGWDK